MIAQWPYTADFHKYTDKELLKVVAKARAMDAEEKVELIEEVTKRWQEVSQGLKEVVAELY